MTRVTRLVFLVGALLLVAAAPSQAFTIDWSAIGWDPNDTSGSQSFTNVDGSEGTLDSAQLAAFQIFVFSDQRFNFWIDDVVFAAGP